MSYCYVCETELTVENRSDEHILLNCSGARLHSKDLLCSKHNSAFGDEIDSDLCKQFSSIATLMNISRHRGNPPPFKAVGTKSGKTFNVLPGGKPEHSEPELNISKHEEKAEFTLKARSTKEAKRMLEGLKRKYPKLNVEEAMAAAKPQREYIRESVEMKLAAGGPMAFKSILKSFVSFYIYSGGNREDILELIPLISSTNAVDVPVGNFFDGNTLVSTPPAEMYHLIAIIGDPASGQLLGYVEYFRGFKFLALLSNRYRGPKIEFQYIYDPVSVNQLPAILLNWNSAFEAITDVLQAKRQNLETVTAEFRKVLAVVMKVTSNNAIEEVTQTAIEEFKEKFKGEEVMTVEMSNWLATRIAELAMPLLIRPD